MSTLFFIGKHVRVLYFKYNQNRIIYVYCISIYCPIFIISDEIKNFVGSANAVGAQIEKNTKCLFLSSILIGFWEKMTSMKANAIILNFSSQISLILSYIVFIFSHLMMKSCIIFDFQKSITSIEFSMYFDEWWLHWKQGNYPESIEPVFYLRPGVWTFISFRLLKSRSIVNLHAIFCLLRFSL